MSKYTSFVAVDASRQDANLNHMRLLSGTKISLLSRMHLLVLKSLDIARLTKGLKKVCLFVVESVVEFHLRFCTTGFENHHMRIYIVCIHLWGKKFTTRELNGVITTCSHYNISFF